MWISDAESAQIGRMLRLVKQDTAWRIHFLCESKTKKSLRKLLEGLSWNIRHIFEPSLKKPVATFGVPHSTREVKNSAVQGRYLTYPVRNMKQLKDLFDKGHASYVHGFDQNFVFHSRSRVSYPKIDVVIHEEKDEKNHRCSTGY
ncbi:hypothetical protein VKT23_006487 [Stygiomarasmius scandens]|uniref:Uncharacterized protein n=1 Tax=Marasmiellus scandens TaxID=2682957 RepID=A0ABR1JNQ8_9AGAR